MTHWLELPFEKIDLRSSVDICSQCVFAQQFQLAHVPFEIVGSNPAPDILFIAESPGYDEIDTGRLLIGKSGSFLRDMLQTITESYALANTVSCHPTNIGKRKIRTPERSESEYCVAHVRAFIEQIQPKWIIPLGSVAYHYVLPPSYLDACGNDAKSVGKMVGKPPVVIDGITYGCCYHPSFLIRNGGAKSLYYNMYIKRIYDILSVSPTSSAIPGETPLHLITPPIVAPQHDLHITYHTLDDLPYILQALEPYDDIGFDYEARHLQTWALSNIPTGFGLAHAIDATSGRAYYVDCHFHDGSSDAQRRVYLQQHLQPLYTFLQQKKCVWTFNAKYEGRLSWALFGERLFFNDAAALVKMDAPPSWRTSMNLKESSQRYLGVELWNEEVNQIASLYEKIFEGMKVLHEEFPHIFRALRQGDWSTFSLFRDEPTIKPPKKKKKKNAMPEECNGNGQISLSPPPPVKRTKAVNAACTKITQAYDSLCDLIGEVETLRGFQYYPWAWEAIPFRILGEYCAWDAYNTVRVKEKLWDEHKDHYRFYIMQTFLATAIESYGACYDNDHANVLNTYYVQEALLCLKTLIELLDFPDEEKMRALDIFHNGQRYASLDAQLEDLKTIFNPNSNDPKAQVPFWKAFKTDYTISCAMFRVLEQEIYESESLNEDTYLPMMNRENLEETIYTFSHYLSSLQGKEYRALHTLLATVEDKALAYFRGYAKEVTQFFYEALSGYGGVDIENVSTWTNEFAMLYNLHRFRRVLKSNSNVIWGSNGRENLSLARIDVTDITKPPLRLTDYTDVPSQYILKPDERWILNIDYTECAKETHRWGSGFHLVPNRSEAKELYIPRFDDSILVHFDFSTMEVRIMAVLAQEPELLRVLEQGLDMHSYIASQIYRIPVEEVTPTQRQNAKTFVFSILFGKGEETFARDNMHGDRIATAKFFADFFTAFPNLKRYIQHCHQEGITYKRTKMLLGNYLKLEMGKQGIGGLKRNAQNGGVQCLHPGTLIPLLNGENVTVEELALRGEPFWVYAFDRVQNEYKRAFASRAWKTGEVHSLVRVTLDNGKSLETTDFHQYLLRNGEYIRADQLKIGDALMPLTLSTSISGQTRGEVHKKKVVNVEMIYYDIPLSVYDIEVPIYNNFGTTAGVIIHNSSASMIAGYYLALLHEKVQQRRLQAIPVGFTHDAGDWDVRVSDLLNFIPMMNNTMVNQIRQDYNVPVAIEYGIGIHQNHMMHLIHQQEYGHFHYVCPEMTFESICQKLEREYTISFTKDRVKDKRGNFKDEYYPLKDLFGERGAFSRYFGEKISMIEGEIILTAR